MRKEIEEKLKTYQDPYFETDLVTSKALRNITVSDAQIHLDIVLGYPDQTTQAAMQSRISALLATVAPTHQITFDIKTCIDPHVGHPGIPAYPNVKNIIAVASGKGGVGKSTVSVNTALALAKEGARVGLLDADVYGPSQPAMLGAVGQTPEWVDKRLQPIERYGIQTMSIGYLVDATAPMIWRGPMLGKALQQLLQDTDWRNLDYLIVDLPPGTGDIQLTLCQKMPLSGAIIVTTPQDLALLDVKRACEAFIKLNIPIIGVIENMSVYHCPQCGHSASIFGSAGGAMLATEYQVPLLGSIPLNMQIRTHTDRGQPPVVLETESDYAKVFFDIAKKTAAKLALFKKDYSAKFGKIIKM